MTPADIAKLRLRPSTFVFLRVCQGEDAGFADAFLKAGAKAVWANRGVIDVAVATRQLDAFLTQMGKGATVIEAISRVSETDGEAMERAVLFTGLSLRDFWRRTSDVRPDEESAQ